MERFRSRLGVLASLTISAGALVLMPIGTQAGAGPSESPQPRPSSASLAGLGGNGLIAFDAENDIWVVAPDGSGLRRLTETPDMETQPTWSPDGTRLAYRITNGDSGVLVIMAADGRIEREISEVAGLSLDPGGDALWSPDSRRVAIKPSLTDLSKVILVEVATGTGTLLDMGMPVGKVHWTPDGSLAFKGGDETDHGIYVAATDGTDLRRISDEDRWAVFDSALWGNFSPDGRSVVYFARSPDGSGHDVIVGAVDGSGARVLVDGSADDQQPTYSPDGRLIAFARTAPGADAADLVLVTPAGAETTILANGVCSICTITWSPDGARLAAWSPDYSELIILALDGSLPPVRVPSPGNVGAASWQPIGS